MISFKKDIYFEKEFLLNIEGFAGSKL